MEKGGVTFGIIYSTRIVDIVVGHISFWDGACQYK